MSRKAFAFFTTAALVLLTAWAWGLSQQADSMARACEQMQADALQQAYDRGVADARAGLA